MSRLTDQAEWNFYSLAVSGECSSGKSTLCEILSRRLNWKHVDVGNEFRKICEHRGLKIEEFGSIPDPLLRQIDDQIQHRIKTKVNIVWDGRLTCYLARNITKIFKVYCMADPNIRAERSASRNKISLREARGNVFARDSEEMDVFKRLYGFSNPYNKKWINLLLDTSYKSSEELADIVLRALKSAVFPQNT